jgi:hypothetical protein
MNAPANAVIIDPFTRTIDPASLDLSPDNSYSALRRAVFRDGSGFLCHVGLGPLPRTPLAPSLSLSGYVDDEGIFMDWDQQAFFRLARDAAPLAGRMVIVASDVEGETRPIPADFLPLLVERLREIVEWIEPQQVRVPVPTFQQLDDNLQPVGEPEPLTPDGRAEWDYNHQP